MSVLFSSCTPVSVFIDRPLQRTVLPEVNVLLVEHRDEIFARLHLDLSRVGIGVYRATCPEEVFRLHSRIPIALTVMNSGLPQSSLWLTTAKLRLQDPLARIWTYMANPFSQDRDWSQLAGIEKVISYDGSLFQLTARVQYALRGPTLLKAYVTIKLRDAS